MDLDTEIAQGARAAEILNDAVYLNAYSDIKQEILTQWQQSPARDPEGREKLYIMLNMLDKVQQMLQLTMESGKVASDHLRHKKSLFEKSKAALSNGW